jgi:hypothetical protein
LNAAARKEEEETKAMAIQEEEELEAKRLKQERLLSKKRQSDYSENLSELFPHRQDF